MEWKVGDWCFFEYALREVKAVKDGKPSELDNGVATTYVPLTSLSSNSCFPLLMEIKEVSDKFANKEAELEKFFGTIVNMWRIRKYFIELWVEYCRKIGNEEKQKEIIEQWVSFCQKVEDNSREVFRFEVDDVAIF